MRRKQLWQAWDSRSRRLVHEAGRRFREEQNRWKAEEAEQQRNCQTAHWVPSTSSFSVAQLPQYSVPRCWVHDLTRDGDVHKNPGPYYYHSRRSQKQRFHQQPQRCHRQCQTATLSSSFRSGNSRGTQASALRQGMASRSLPQHSRTKGFTLATNLQLRDAGKRHSAGAVSRGTSFNAYSSSSSSLLRFHRPQPSRDYDGPYGNRNTTREESGIRFACVSPSTTPPPTYAAVCRGNVTSSSSSASYGAQNCPHCGFKLRLDDSVNVSRQPITPKSSQLRQSVYNDWQPVRQHQRRHFRNSFRNLTPASTNMYAPLLSLERRTQWDSTDDDPPTVSWSKLRQPQKRTTYHFRNVCLSVCLYAPLLSLERRTQWDSTDDDPN